jgi:hypothetical protein
VTVSVVLVLVAAACGGGISKADKQVLDQAVAAVQPQRLGTVIEDFRSGSSHGLGDPASRSITVFAKGTGTQTAAIASLMAAARFEKRGLSEWDQTLNGHLVIVRVTSLASGATSDDLLGHVAAVPEGTTALVFAFVAERN